MRLFVLTILVGLSACGPAVNPHASEIALAKHSLEATLNDPSSVQYRGVRYNFADAGVADKQATGIVCGEFNSKNRLGGYSGFEPFIYVAAHNAVLPIKPSMQADPRMALPWLKMCGTALPVKPQVPY